MDTFGERLHSERQDRGLTIDAVAERLRIDPDHLLALERNDFGALPEEAVMMDCLHGYADCLDVDAELMIEDYASERAGYLQRLKDAAAEQEAAAQRAATAKRTAEAKQAAEAKLAAEAKRIVAAEQEVVAARVTATVFTATSTNEERRFAPSWMRASWIAALLLVAVVILVGWSVLSRRGTASTAEVPVATAPVEQLPLSPESSAVEAPTESQPMSSKTSSKAQADAVPTSTDPVAVEPAPKETTPEETTVGRPVAKTAARSSLTIGEHGVGTTIENRRLVGQSDRFTEGTKVWFLTRVLGGSSGDKIRHVWLREGVEVARVSLKIGGTSWRTFSSKTLVAGDWAVEARDDAGRVLARSEFACY